MGTSDAKKRANHKWDAENMSFFGVKMPKREGDALKAACKRRGVSPHSIFLAAARALIAEDTSAETETPDSSTSTETETE